MNVENKAELETESLNKKRADTVTEKKDDGAGIVLDAADQAKGKKLQRRFKTTEGILYVKSTLNNTIATLTDMKGNKMKGESAGMYFKGSKKSTPYASYMVADKIAKWALMAGIKSVDIRLKSLGSLGGVTALVRTAFQKGLNVRLICDITPVPHGGCRPRKPRRN